MSLSDLAAFYTRTEAEGSSRISVGEMASALRLVRVHALSPSLAQMETFLVQSDQASPDRPPRLTGGLLASVLRCVMAALPRAQGALRDLEALYALPAQEGRVITAGEFATVLEALHRGVASTVPVVNATGQRT